MPADSKSQPKSDRRSNAVVTLLILTIAAVVLVGANLIWSNVIRPYAIESTSNMTKFRKEVPVAPTFRN